MTRKGRPDRDLGLEGVECVTLRDERLVEEAPAAYKDIGPVVQVQVEHGLVSPVAVLRPLLTFKA
jgi:tRNA-splicing ligase RtcB